MSVTVSDIDPGVRSLACYDGSTDGEIARQLAELRRRGIRAGVGYDPTGLEPPASILDIRSPADLPNAVARADAALSTTRQVLTLRFADCTGSDAIAVFVARLRERHAAATLLRRCQLQLSRAQALDASLRKLLAAHRVLVTIGAGEVRRLSDFRALVADRPWACVFPTAVRSTCAPLGPERGTDFAGPGLIACSPRSAVLAVDIDCSSAATGALGERVRLAVRVADRLVERLAYADAAVGYDAFLNRRLALLPRGLGACIRGATDTDRALGDARRLLREIRHTARDESRRLAARSGAFPAMNPRHAMPARSSVAETAAWRRRWADATLDCRYRHRQLIAVDLADLWPGSEAGCALYAELIPLARFADTVAFGVGWSFAGNNLAERFRLFRYAEARLAWP